MEGTCLVACKGTPSFLPLAILCDSVSKGFCNGHHFNQTRRKESLDLTMRFGSTAKVLAK